MVKKMRLGVLFILITIIFSVHSQSVATKKLISAKTVEEKKQCRNLICLFDPDNRETLFGNAFVFIHFIKALQEQVAPIIVTSGVLRRFCYWKQHPKKVIKNLTIQDILSQKIVEKTGILLTQFNDDDWHCYAHKKAELMLLIPKKYIASHASEHLHDVRLQVEQCGFDVNNLDKINDVSPSTVLRYINQHTRTNDTLIDCFESMFIKNKNQPDDKSVWNIFATGHGNVAFIDRKHTAQSIATRMHEIRQAMISKDASFREIERYKTELFDLQQMSDELKKYGVIRKGSIAGLSTNDFLRLISFFENGIKTTYLHYTTCFSGGFNQALINEELSRLKASFIISVEGINESVAMVLWNGMYGSTMFANFFDAIDNFFCKFVEIDPYQVKIKDPIAEIVSTVVDNRLIDWNQPFVRIPEVGVFNAFAVDKRVKILTHSMAKAYESAEMTIDFTDPKIKTVFMYPSYIKSPLKIKEHVAIVSLVPQHVLVRETVHVIEKMFYDDRLSSIIPNFVSFNTRYEPIIFIIKELHCLDYKNSGLEVGDQKPIIIKNVIIYIKGSESSTNYLDVAVDVVFSFNDKYYLLSEKIEEVQNNIKGLFKGFKGESVRRLMRSDWNSLIAEIIPDDVIKTFNKKKITVADTIKYFEGKVDKSVISSESHLLLHIPLFKKLDTLERLITQESLNKQKELLASRNQPLTILVRNLNRYKYHAEKLEKEINALQKGELSDFMRDDLRKRIINVLTAIDKEYELIVSQLSWSDYARARMLYPLDVVKKVRAKVRKKLTPSLDKRDYEKRR